MSEDTRSCTGSEDISRTTRRAAHVPQENEGKKFQPKWDATPQKHGLYDPQFEIGECGVGAIINLDGNPTKKLLEDARRLLVRMTHRGAAQAHEGDGDGAGVLMSVPDDLLRRQVDFQLPEAGQYGVGNIFLPTEEARRRDCIRILSRQARRLGLKVAGWRLPLPCNVHGLGPYALATMPYIGQVFIVESTDPDAAYSGGESPSASRKVRAKRHKNRDNVEIDLRKVRQLPLDTRLYVLRKIASQRAKEMFICSLHSKVRKSIFKKSQVPNSPAFALARLHFEGRTHGTCAIAYPNRNRHMPYSVTIVYKGQFKPDQLFQYYKDLCHPHVKASLAICHSRFSTNSFPAWQRAHPYRLVAHNGEINTYDGNRNLLKAREALLANNKNFDGIPIDALFPIDEDIGSDTALLDNMLELLAHGGRDLCEAVMMIIPEAWQKDLTMPQEKRAFYEYMSCCMEPWDGPALLLFTDGKQFGATLDRNGLRPARYYLMDNQQLILASEVGVVDVDENRVLHKGRLRPGKMLLCDLEEGKVLKDDDVKMKYATKHNYSAWVEAGLIHLANNIQDYSSYGDERMLDILWQQTADSTLSKDWDITSEVSTVSSKEDRQNLLALLTQFGYTYEKMEMLVFVMAKTGQEPLGSMGADLPLACFSRLPRSPFDYLYQLFAQATNPAIDPIRECNVMSLECPIGPESSLLEPGPQACRRVMADVPVLCPARFEALTDLPDMPSVVLDMTYPFETSSERRADRAITGVNIMEERLGQICEEAEVAIVSDEACVIVLSHRRAGKFRVALPSLLAVGAIHQHLINTKLRAHVALVVEAADCFEVHHFACLLGAGCVVIYPYLCYLALSRERKPSAPLRQRIDLFRNAVHNGLLKVMSKMGISCLQSYKGAQLFNAVGLHQEILNKCFSNLPTVLPGVGFNFFDRDARRLHKLGYPRRELPPLVDNTVSDLPDFGEYHFRAVGDTEIRLNNPDVIMRLQQAVRSTPKEIQNGQAAKMYRDYADWENRMTEVSEIRGQLEICYEDCNPIDVSEVEPASEIVKRFVTGAMSLGSISTEAHQSLAVAMNRIGGKSNTGEGGEDPARSETLFASDVKMGAATWELRDGDSYRSKIKQVASGRFGVSIEYLDESEEIQIKLAQGAKPGEGGELPGIKVDSEIARIRGSTPGVGLISPPPHHDLYSIEDVAQLIYDLKHANPNARVSLKLVSRVGVGIIASGLVKGKADHVVISGMSGGTGAAKWTSIKHTGLPWEFGLAETHQTLVLNGLRDRVVLQADGQIRTGKDIIYAALLGAEEVAFSTVPLISLGCVMMRKCHLNTCPVGIATQDPELRKKFEGKPENVINLCFLVAEEIRQMMAKLGLRKFSQMVGRTDLLRPRTSLAENPKTANLDFSELLRPAWSMERLAGDSRHQTPMICCRAQDHDIGSHLDNSIHATIIPALDERKKVKIPDLKITNEDRSVGALLSHFILMHKRKAKKHAEAELSSPEISKKDLTVQAANNNFLRPLPNGLIHIQYKGSAGQSFGCFLTQGVMFELEGDANDGCGKSLSGGQLILYPPKDSVFTAADNVIVGNASFYGATRGRALIRGRAAERFAVRNSGAVLVVEGVGDHGCEYMTGGLVLVLGPIGKNFGAGMSGGIAFILDIDPAYINMQTVYLEPLHQGSSDETVLRDLLEQHAADTGSVVAQELLNDWHSAIHRFTKVFPKEFKKVIREAIVDHTRSSSHVAARILSGYESLLNPIPERRTGSDRGIPNIRAIAKQLNVRRQQYNMDRGEKQTSFLLDEPMTLRAKRELQMQDQASLAALGLGDVGVELEDVVEDLAAGEVSFTNSLRRSYLLWRKGLKGQPQNVLMKKMDVIQNMSKSDTRLKSRYPKGWERFKEGHDKRDFQEPLSKHLENILSGMTVSQKENRLKKHQTWNAQNDDAMLVSPRSKRNNPSLDLQNIGHSDLSPAESRGNGYETPPKKKMPLAVSKKGQEEKDLEDLAGNANDKKKEKRPHAVSFALKRKGFHEYARATDAYRDATDRVYDWQPILRPNVGNSKLWHNLMHTQTARCMDCGTPTCHYPNQGGGGCPLGNRIPTWNTLVHEGEWKRALERLLDTNNFPEFTGTTCPAPCEEACVLGINEDPVAIKMTENAILDYAFAKGWLQPHPPKSRTNKRVAVVGSGPCGLAAAQQLNKAGHYVTVYERDARPGGLLSYGIPNMKLDKDKVARRIDLLQKEGITFTCDVEIGDADSSGHTFTLQDLRSKHDAVLLSTGSLKARGMPSSVPGSHLKNVVQAMDFLAGAQKTLDVTGSGHVSNILTDAASTKTLSTHHMTISAEGKHVVVIGGGDTAVDVIATCIRMGAKSVTQFSRRDKAPEEQPKHKPWPYWADGYRGDYAHREAEASHSKDPREYRISTTSFEPSSTNPKAVGSVKAKRASGPESINSKSLKKADSSVSNDSVKDLVFPADLVVLAMGFTGPDNAVDPAGKVPRTTYHNFDAAYGDYRVKNGPFDGLFAAGDCRRGASLVVTAIAEGRDAAHRIDEYLMGESILPRCAPLAANPAFYVRDWQDTGATTTDLRRKKTQKQFKLAAVSEQFERGYLNEDPMPSPSSRGGKPPNLPRVPSRAGMLSKQPSLLRESPRASDAKIRLEEENHRLQEQLLRMKESMEDQQERTKKLQDDLLSRTVTPAMASAVSNATSMPPEQDRSMQYMMMGMLGLNMLAMTVAIGALAMRRN
eukprot:gene834-151_t